MIEAIGSVLVRRRGGTEPVSRDRSGGDPRVTGGSSNSWAFLAGWGTGLAVAGLVGLLVAGRSAGSDGEDGDAAP